MSAVRDGEPVFISCVPVLCVCRCYLRVCTVFIKMYVTFLVITFTRIRFQLYREVPCRSLLSPYSNVCTGRRIAYKAYISNITGLDLVRFRYTVPDGATHYLHSASTIRYFIVYTPYALGLALPNIVRRCGPQAVRFRPGSVSRDRQTERWTEKNAMVHMRPQTQTVF